MAETNVPLLGQKSPEDEVTVITEALTALLVFVTPDGNYAASADINMPIEVERKPTLMEMKAMLAVVLSEIEKEETAVLAAQHTLNAQMQMARQVQEQQQAAQILSKGNLRA